MGVSGPCVLGHARGKAEAEQASLLGKRAGGRMVGPRKRAEVRGKGEGEGWAAQGFVWAGHWVWFPFSFTTSISKTNKQSLNSNTNLNSNHTQIIKTMHQHECNTKI